MPEGPKPTWIGGLIARRFTGSIRCTWSAPDSLTHTAPSPYATAIGRLATLILATTERVFGSISTTDWPIAQATQIAFPPAAMPSAPSSVGMNLFSASAFVLGSTLPTASPLTTQIPP